MSLRFLPVVKNRTPAIENIVDINTYKSVFIPVAARRTFSSS
jgi:hypothetical protein